MRLKPHLLPRLSRSFTNPHTRNAIPLILTATMSTTTPPAKREWLCIMPDQEDAIDRRLKVREQHFVQLKPLVDSGFVSFAGASLNEPEEPGKQMAFRGSVLTCVAETKEAVVEVLKKDPYTVDEVWDWNKAEIYPFKCAVRQPLQK